ncbi:MAG: transposase [Ktedonobacterales bacterium]
MEQGIVSVNAYGVLDQVTFPLAFALYKPKTCLKPGDRFQTKPELALALIQQLLEFGFRFEVVLADTVYGDNSTFINALYHLGLRYAGRHPLQPWGLDGRPRADPHDSMAYL